MAKHNGIRRSTFSARNRRHNARSRKECVRVLVRVAGSDHFVACRKAVLMADGRCHYQLSEADVARHARSTRGKARTMWQDVPRVGVAARGEFEVRPKRMVAVAHSRAV